MSKSYSLADNAVIRIVEMKEVVEEVSIEMLKAGHASLLIEIERLKVNADAIADKLGEINANVPEVTIEAIPFKFDSAVVTKEK